MAGADPVGLTLALALRRQGIAVRIVDKAAARSDKSKALVIWPRTLELLDIQGRAQVFTDTGVRARGARIRGQGRELAHVHFGLARSAYPFALMIPQSETERLLEQLLAAACDSTATRWRRTGCMNTGMQDAFNLAWKLALVQRGQAAPGTGGSCRSSARRAASEVLCLAPPVEPSRVVQ